MKSFRQNKIIEVLSQKEFCTIKEMAHLLEVTEMTIRRDINELSSKDLIIKEYGGARRRNEILTTSEKIDRNVKEKEYIGKVMNKLIGKDDVIFLGAGTTFFHAIKFLNHEYKSIITNSLFSFNWLAENGYPNIFLTGGELFEQTGEFFGSHAESLLDNFNIDIAFLATNGILNENITTSKPTLGSMQNKAIECSKKSIAIADSSKFDLADSYTFITLDKVDAIITDNKLSEEKLNRYKKYTEIIN